MGRQNNYALAPPLAGSKGQTRRLRPKYIPTVRLTGVHKGYRLLHRK